MSTEENWKTPSRYIISSHPEIYFKLETDKKDLTHKLDAYLYHKDKKNIVYVLHVVDIFISTKTLEYENKMYNGAIHSFYNYTTTDLEDLLKEISDDLKLKLKGLAYSLLCYLINYCLRNNYLKLTDNIFLEASGNINKDKDMINLYKMYLSLGFTLIDSNYIEKYKKLAKEIKILDDRIKNEEDLDINDETEKLEKIHHASFTNIPMEGNIGNFLDICKVKPKQEIKCRNLNKPRTCTIEIKDISGLMQNLTI
jgi:hypothetical protein